MMAGWHLLRRIHLILAVVAGALLVVTGATGTLLAFRTEIDRVMNPSLWHVEPGTGHASLENVRKTVEASGGPPPRMFLFSDSDDVALLVLLVGRGPADRWEVFVDPYTGKILGRRQFGSAWTEKVKQLHVELFSGRKGRLVVGAGGVVSLLMGATGMALWWGTRKVRIEPKSQWGAFALHRRIGILGLVPSVILALSGSLLIFRPYIAPVLNRLTGPMPLETAAKSRDASDGPAPLLDETYAKAASKYPDGRITRLYLPEGREGSFAVRICLPEDGNPNGNTAVRFDRYSGAVVQEHTSRATNGVQKLLWYAAYPWHTGDVMGAPGKAIVAICGLLPSVLLLTGVQCWWARRKRSKRPSPRAAT